MGSCALRARCRRGNVKTHFPRSCCTRASRVWPVPPSRPARFARACVSKTRIGTASWCWRPLRPRVRDMRLPAYLKRSRHGIYYVRCVLPAARAGAQGANQSSFSVSLRTREPEKAATLSRMLGVQVARVLPAVRAAIRRNDETAVAMVKAFQQSVCGWVSTITRGDVVVRIEANPHDPVDHARAIEAVERLLHGGNQAATSATPMLTPAAVSMPPPPVPPPHNPGQRQPCGIAASLAHRRRRK